jgi:hypothetical protein
MCEALDSIPSIAIKKEKKREKEGGREGRKRWKEGERKEGRKRRGEGGTHLSFCVEYVQY